jgi:hypothetical protein
MEKKGLPNLYLTLKKCWWDAIAQGKKLEEYREIKPWSTSRLYRDNQPRQYDRVIFRNGYALTSPVLSCPYRGVTKRNNQYVIALGPATII